MSRTFTVDELEDLDLHPDDCVYSYGHGPRRWSETFDLVFKAEDDGRLYLVQYERGLTEYQEYAGYERYPGYKRTQDGQYIVTCPEVEIIEEMRPVKTYKIID